MLLPTTRRLAAGLALLLLSDSALAAVADAVTPMAAESRCVRTRNQQLAFGAACGDEASLARCLLQLPEIWLPKDLEACFAQSGCAADEAVLEAAWALQLCNDSQGNNSNNDLRRRQKQPNNPQPSDPNANNGDGTDPLTTPEQPQPAPTTAKDQKPTDKAATTPKPAKQQTTQQPAPQTTPPAAAAAAQQTTSSEDNVVVVTQTDPATSVTAGVAQADQETTTPLTCIITTTVQTTICPIQTVGPSKGQPGPCVPTALIFPTCSPGLFCSTDPQGNPTCMKFHNQLDTGGIIVAIGFGTAILAAIVGIVSLCCRDRKRAREAARRAAANAALAAAGKKPTASGRRGVSGDRVPLIPAHAAAGADAAGSAPGGYAPVGAQEQDPFHDRQGH